MKAITVTEEIKNLNIELFKNNIVGSIKEFKDLPKSFYSPNYNNGQRTDGYNVLYKEIPNIYELDGFYDLIIPVDKVDYFKETQRLGNVYFDENLQIFTKEILQLTQEQLDLEAKEDFKNNLEGVFAFATTPDGTKEYAIKIGNDGKILTVLVEDNTIKLK